jgi:hypothetical protein
MANVLTVNVQSVDLRLLIWQDDSFTPLTASHPAVVDLLAALAAADLQVPLIELDIAPQLAPDGTITGWRYWAGALGSDQEWIREWKSGQIAGNVPGRREIALLVSQHGLRNIDAHWEQPVV